MSSGTEWALQLQLSGRVQGIGFRPAIHRRATRLGLGGWVANNTSGVILELHGSRPQLEVFLKQLLRDPPTHSRMDQVQPGWRQIPCGKRPFRIVPSQPSPGSSALIAPDLALCRACLAELLDPSNRRFGYPFISCAQCGPRYSLLQTLPFERDNTSFSAFPPCPTCAAEYANPEDRRFHAQTISCPACGPSLSWNQRIADYGEGLQAATQLLQAGGILALQGVGGFQLLADPTHGQALARLRTRKGRPEKPLALLSSRAALEEICRPSEPELELWQSPLAPIVLMRRSPDAGVDARVAGSSPWLGVMRPASGLQQLLLEHVGSHLVCTSANRSGEPIAADVNADEALLASLADGVLSHELRIVNRIDDSVMRWAAGAPLVLRLGRGLAPLALPTQAQPCSAPVQLAVGAQVKGAFALQLKTHRVLSPDLGDLSSRCGAEHFESTSRTWMRRHAVTPRWIVSDRHRSYSSSAYAEHLSQSLPARRLQVQHHQAHLLAVMAEHGLSGAQCGLAWDGSGLGDDGTIWGGEALELEGDSYRRVATLRSFPLPGGERALREPRRAALGMLLEAYGPNWRARLQPLETPWWSAFPEADRALLEQSLVCGVNRHRCSSMGRLFDGFAALLGVQQTCSFEAQAAMALEGLATQALERGEASPTYPLPLEWSAAEGIWVWNWAPLLEAVLNGLGENISPAALSLAFHQSLAQAVVNLAQSQGVEQLLLAGGCFQNKLLLERCVLGLQQVGVRAIWCQQLPCNDASLPIGQLLAVPQI